MPYTAVRVAKPARALVVAALADSDGPLAQAVRVGNRRVSGPVVGNKTDPASRPAFGCRWTGFDGPRELAETFAREGGAFDPDKPPPGIVTITHNYEITLDTANYNHDEAADLFDDAYGSLLLKGPGLGDGSNPPKVRGWTVGGGRVDDTANDADTRRGDRPPSPGVANHRITFTVRVTLDLSTADIMPQEV